MTVEHHRKIAMEKVLAIKTWKKCWAVWEKDLSLRTNGFTDATKVHELGDHLREVFFATNTGRSQRKVAAGGAGWECLVTWYLNLILSGTNAVAMKQSKDVLPKVLMDATTVTYGTHLTNTESDICVVIYPDDFVFPKPDAGFMKNLNLEVSKRISSIELGIIQCKTNWNDNAQVPMLWDMVYRGSFSSTTAIHIGKNGYHIGNLSRFTYSFVTVPTQKEKKIPSKPTQMPVKRLSNITGGNYWGMETKSGVALSLSEIFNRNFSNAFKVNVRESVKNAIDSKIGLFK